MSMSDNGGGAASNTLGIQMLRTIAQQISAMTAAIQAVFPAATASATSATTGSASALPADPAGYLVVTLPGGGVGKVPYYNS